MGETKHPAEPEKAAAQKIAFAIWPEERGFTEDDSWISQKVAEFTLIIKEIATVTLQAKIDRLEAEKAELKSQINHFEVELEDLPDDLRAEIEEYKDRYLCLLNDHKRLEAEKAELVEAHRAISTLHGNMSLDSIERVGGINDGRDRAIKLRAAIEISRALLAKHNPKPREV